MADIRVLDASVYNKISAGEVIEKPSSVVKELVENALDAGANRITICIEGGGLTCIEVGDNGCGIARDQLSKVFLPHATSKIAVAEDLFDIHTLGFRGEAMASIAAVAQVTLVSRVADDQAYTLSCSGGVMGEILPVGSGFGTTVTVRNLFYHTPVRLKFMRSAKSETHDVTAYVQRLVLANPSVAFHYTADDKVLLHTDGTGLDEAVHAVLGEDVCDHLVPVDAAEYGYAVRGFVSDSLYSAGTRAQQYTILNGRVVANANLYGAVANAYRDYLMKRQYPIFVLLITMPVEEVDVNVHPTKADVRFQYANKLFGFVYRAVKKAVEGSMAGRLLSLDTPPTPSVGEETHIELSATPTMRQQAFFEENRAATRYRQRILSASDVEDKVDEQDLLHYNTASDVQQAPDERVTRVTDEACDEENEATAENGNESETGAVSAHAWRIVGQLLGTYVVVEYDDAMLLVDQHAAAERVLYDRLVEHYTKGDVVVQPLLVPYEFDLSEEDADALDMRLDVLRSMGLEIDKTGDTHFVLVALPAILVGMDMPALIRYVLAEQPTDRADLFKEKLAYAACRAALKGNTHLDNEAIEMLCRDLFAQGLPSQCPHGRPAYVRLTRYALDKMFRRIV